MAVEDLAAAGGVSNSNRAAKPTLRQNINSNFNYQHAANDIYTAFPAFGGNNYTNSLAFGAGYTIGYGRLTNNLSITWNRSHGVTHNYFTGVSNPANSNCAGTVPATPLLLARRLRHRRRRAQYAAQPAELRHSGRLLRPVHRLQRYETGQPGEPDHLLQRELAVEPSPA